MFLFRRRPRRDRAGIAWILGAALVAVTALASVAPSFAQDEEQTLQQFLARLGLVDLQTLHLEQSLARTRGDAARVELARRLADLYAERLMNAGEDEASFQETLSRVQSLLRNYPQADTAAIRVMLLQADYNRAEGQVAQWLADPANDAARSAARETLARIAPELERHQTELSKVVERLMDEVDLLPEGDQLQAKESELQRRQALAGQAQYFAAWSKYYLGLTQTGGPRDTSLFSEAAALFRKLLGIAEGDYAKVSPDDLGLMIAYRARSAIGLGMSEIALGNVAAAERCFGWLHGSGAPPAIQDQADYWHTQGLLNVGKTSEALAVAKKRVAAMQGEATPGKVSLCAALVRAAYAEGSAASPERQEMGRLGLAGLMRLGQQGAVRQLIEKHNIPLEKSDSFYLQWLRGQQLFAEAKASGSSEGFEEAAEVFAAALATKDAKDDPASAAACRYELGFSHYQAGKFEAAARQFQQAYATLKSTGNASAPDAGWMAFVAFRQAGQSEPRHNAAAIDALTTLKRDFPQHKYAQNADYQIAKVRQASGSAEETIRRLSQIAASDPAYPMARYDLCVLLHQQLPKPGEPRRKGAVEELEKAVEQYLQIRGAEPERKVKCGLMLAEAALDSQPPEAERAAAAIQRIASLAESLPSDDSRAAEYHYRRLQLARAAGDDAARREHAQWLVEHAASTAYELPALIVSASAVEDRVKSASAQDRPALINEANRLFRRLVDRLGDSPQAIAGNKNARVASSKLAHYAFESGDFETAALQLEKLLAAEPKDADLLRRAGLANFRAGKHAQALPHWRTLLLGLPKGSEEWFEAKWHQIASLAKADPPEAQKTWKNFVLLYPNLGPASWRERFKSLEREIPQG